MKELNSMFAKLDDRRRVSSQYLLTINSHFSQTDQLSSYRLNRNVRCPIICAVKSASKYWLIRL